MRRRGPFGWRASVWIDPLADADFVLCFVERFARLRRLIVEPVSIHASEFERRKRAELAVAVGRAPVVAVGALVDRAHVAVEALFDDPGGTTRSADFGWSAHGTSAKGWSEPPNLEPGA